ncbi:MAG: ester cyclase [Blastocatellia bacterium]
MPPPTDLLLIHAAAHHWTVTGTHAGEFMGHAPTGRQFTIDGISIYRIADGRLVEEHTIWDALGLMKQLGLTA